MSWLERHYEGMNGFARRRRQELTILLYHGVTRARSRGLTNAWAKHIDVSTFRRQLAYLREECVVMSMDEVVSHLGSGRAFAPNSVAITFDDGFRNNVEVAAPILAELELPATFYVTCGMVGTDRVFWVDHIAACVEAVAGDSLTLELEQPTELALSFPDDRVEAVRRIKRFCKRVDVRRKDRVLADLSEITGLEPTSACDEDSRVASWDEIRALASDPLFTIGAHTLYHEILTRQPPPRMRCDVRASLDLLSYHLNQRIRHFSYPEGQEDHYDANVIRALRGVGVSCCPTAIPGTNPGTTDPFHLRRVMVGFEGVPFPFTDPRLMEPATAR